MLLFVKNQAYLNNNSAKQVVKKQWVQPSADTEFNINATIWNGNFYNVAHRNCNIFSKHRCESYNLLGD